MKSREFIVRTRDTTEYEINARYEITAPKTVAIELVYVYASVYKKGFGITKQLVKELTEAKYSEIEDKIAERVFAS